MSWVPQAFAPGYLGAPPPQRVSGMLPTSRELRRIAANSILPLWARLRDAVNSECPLAAPSIPEYLAPALFVYRRATMPRFTDVASAKAIPQWCWNDTEVQIILLDFVSQGRSWVATVNTFLAKYGKALAASDPGELNKLGEEFDRISVRLSAVSDFTLENPIWVFFKTLPGELAKGAEDLFKDRVPNLFGAAAWTLGGVGALYAANFFPDDWSIWVTLGGVGVGLYGVYGLYTELSKVF